MHKYLLSLIFLSPTLSAIDEHLGEQVALLRQEEVSSLQSTYQSERRHLIIAGTMAAASTAGTIIYVVAACLHPLENATDIITRLATIGGGVGAAYYAAKTMDFTKQNMNRIEIALLEKGQHA